MLRCYSDLFGKRDKQKTVDCVVKKSGLFWQYHQKMHMLFENYHEFCEKRKSDLILDVKHVNIWVKWKMNENMG